MTKPVPRVVVLDDYQKVATTMADWSSLEGRIDLDLVDHPIADRVALVERLRGAAIVVAMRERTPFDAELLAQLPDLRLLITTGMVNASIDMAAARAHGVTVSGTPGSRGSAAELAWALILALSRRIPAEVEGIRQGNPHWQRCVGVDLSGRTLGLAGFGNLGQRMARIGRAFDMKVVVWSRSLINEVAVTHGVQRAASLDELMAASDFLSLHLPLNDATRGMIGAREFALMKPGSYLVNTSRGPIVDEAALIGALKGEHLAGAGLDVFDIEPLPGNHPFRSMPSVIATPHVGYVTEETYRVYFSGAVEAVEAYLAGAPVRVLNS